MFVAHFARGAERLGGRGGGMNGKLYAMKAPGGRARPDNRPRSWI